MLEELCWRRDCELGYALSILVLLHTLECLDERVRLGSELACEIYLVKTSRLAIERHIAAWLMSHAAKAPEEVEMPERPVKFAIGYNMKT